MQGEKQGTGSDSVNALLEGGFEKDVITTIYGPSSCGKTCLCLQTALTVAHDKKVFYVDTEGGFSPERALQLSNGDQKVWEQFVLFSPTSFEELHKIVMQLPDMLTDKVGLIVVDSIAMLYRLELHKTDDAHAVNRQLALQLAVLNEIARKQHIPVLITNQVYAHFDDTQVRMVGGDLLKYSSKCLIEVQKNGSVRKAILHKHRSLPQKEILFEIKREGIAGVNE